MLHHLRIRAKLALVATVPLLCLVALVLAGAAARAREVSAAAGLADEVRLSVVVTNLVHELQRERGLSSGLVGGGYLTPDRARVDAEREAVDGARDQLLRSMERFGGIDARTTLLPAMARLEGLDDHRSAIDARSLDIAGALRWYTDLIEQYLDATAALGEGTADPALASQLAAYGALSAAKEGAGLERGMMNGVFGAGSFTGEQYSQFLALVATQKVQREIFDIHATEVQRRALDSSQVGPELTRAAELERLATARPIGPLGVEPTEWWDVMTVKVDRYRAVEERLAADVVDAADARASTARSQLVLFFAAGLGLVILSAAVVVATARALSRPIRALTDRAHRSASTDLPRVIASLQDLGGEVTPEVLSPIEVDATAEVGELAEAFNSVQSAAVDLATQQAVLRRNVAEMFINLGRRNQGLIGRLLAFIERLEQDEVDPDQLEKLFRLDHMATRMRRNAESLLVLAGAELPRRWTAPVPLIDVVRAALSEIEDYARVELDDLGDAAVTGSVATDLTHLLAELLENATSFSPPTSRVEVHGTACPEGYLLAIVDYGIGMSEAQLADANARIEELARFDRTPSRLLGLYVVGRLAARHGIDVRLVESATSGVTAKVLVPAALVDELAPAGPARTLEMAPVLVGAVAAGGGGGGGGGGGILPGPAGNGPPLQRRVRPSASRDGVTLLAPIAGPQARQAATGGGEPASGAVVDAGSRSTTAIATIGEHSLRALRKRVRGTQLPDTAAREGHRWRDEAGSSPRTPTDVGASLAAFQAAVERGRRTARSTTPFLSSTEEQP